MITSCKRYRTKVEFCNRVDAVCAYFNTQQEAVDHLHAWADKQKGYSVEHIEITTVNGNSSRLVSEWWNRDCCPEH